MKEKRNLCEKFTYGSAGSGAGRSIRLAKVLALLGMILSLLAAGCGGGKPTAPQGAGDSQEAVDVDLTILNSTMAYSEVSNMMSAPDDYVGKRVKMKGKFSVLQNQADNKEYFACLISDVSTCCSQWLEFEMEGTYTYPDDYPKVEDEVTVVGIFDTYQENGNRYCHLKNAKFL